MREPAERAPLASERLDSLVAILDLVRAGAASTRPELGRRSGLGRTVIAQWVAELMERGLVCDGALGPSTGGRAPRQLTFRAEAGHVLVAELGATAVNVALADLSGRLLVQHRESGDIAAGPDRTLERVEALFDRILAERPDAANTLWGIGIGVPGPVEFATGRPIAPPIMPGWDDYPVRDRLASRYRVSTWVDNEVNTMALGEFRAGLAKDVDDVVYVKIGTGIGAGLISGGRLHRGGQGCAGDVGHVAVGDDTDVVCRCGNVGCLEALAGGAALAREGTRAAQEGRSGYLAEVLASGQPITGSDISTAARHGDQVSVGLLARSGRLIGDMLATVVNFYNPSLIVIGGQVANAGDVLLASIRQVVYRRSLPLATRDLRIVHSALGDRAGLMGAAYMVIDELFSREHLPLWIDEGSPNGRTDIPATAA
ncbi:MAG TPA: ROK family protein [Planosporangium sp.]|nr:ROK family protein [Planosporangium sp.]